MGPDFPVETATLGNNVARLAATDGADRQGRMRRVEGRSRHRRARAFRCQLFNKADDLRGGENRIDAIVRFRGMGRRAAHMGDKLHPALVGVDRRHARRLADDGDAGRHAGSLEKGWHSFRPETAKLLVKGEGEIERLAEFTGAGMKFRGHGQRHGKKSLHIDGAAPVKPPVRAAKAERVALPASGIGGHHIQMAGQQDATRCLRPDPRQKIEPLAVLMRVPPAGDAVRT